MRKRAKLILVILFSLMVIMTLLQNYFIIISQDQQRELEALQQEILHTQGINDELKEEALTQRALHRIEAEARKQGFIEGEILFLDQSATYH